MDWITFFTSTGVSGLLITIVVFMGKKWVDGRISYEFAIKFNEYKAKNKADKVMFLKLQDTLPSNGNIRLVRSSYSIGLWFQWEDIKELYKFREDWIRPEYFFLDSELNEKLRKLHGTICDYTEFIAQHTGPDDKDPNIYAFSRKIKNEKPDKYEAYMEELYSYADRLVEAYDDLVTTGKTKLNL